MIDEYLFLDKEHREIVATYQPDGIKVRICNIKNTPLWTATYSVSNKNEESAKMLSDVHAFLIQYSPIVLSCESAAYYNKKLFPLINDLERKLRELLYLAVSISDDKTAQSILINLEEKDFGEIFDLLFIDLNFIAVLKSNVNATKEGEFFGKSRYTKNEIQEYLNGLKEDAVWDRILGKNVAPTLRKRFRDVQTYRNDVMHAHNINEEIFELAQDLFVRINNELDDAIKEIIKNTEPMPETPKGGVNRSISNALAAMELTNIADALINLTVLSDLTSITEAVKNFSSIQNNAAISEAIKSITLAQNNFEFMDTIKNISSIQNSAAIENAMKNISTIQNSAAISEAINNISSIQNSTKISSIKTANSLNTSRPSAELKQQTENKNEEKE